MTKRPIVVFKTDFGGRKQSVLQETVLCFHHEAKCLSGRATEVLEERIEVRHPLSKMCFATRKCKYNSDFLSLSIICCSNV